MIKQNSTFIDSTELTRWVKWFLYLQIGVAVIALISGGLEYQLLNDLKNGVYKSQAEAAANDMRQEIIGVAQVVVFVLSGILTLRWIYRTNFNVRQLGASDMQFTPAWSVGWYFIPAFHLWKPYQAMKELWGASKNPHDWKNQPVPSLLDWWWLFWIASNLLAQASFRMVLNSDQIDELIAVNIVTLLSDATWILASLTLLPIVSKIYEMQSSHYQHKMPDKKEPQKPPTPRSIKPLQTKHIDEYAVASKIAALIGQTAAENPNALSQQSTYSIALNQDGRVALVKTSFVDLLPSQPIAVVAINQIEGRDAFQSAVESGVFLEQEIDVFSVKVLRALIAAQRKEQSPPSGLSEPQGHEAQAPTIRTDKRFVVGLEEKADDKKILAGFTFGAIILLVFGVAVYKTKQSDSSGSVASTVSDTAIYESVEAPEDAAAAAQDSAVQAAAAATDAANAAIDAANTETVDLSNTTVNSGDSSMDGFYLGYGENANLVMSVANGFATVHIKGESCVGGMDGSIRKIYDNYWMIESGDLDYPCEISMSKKPSSVFTIDQGKGCTHYHGAECGFSGYVVKQ